MLSVVVPSTSGTGALGFAEKLRLAMADVAYELWLPAGYSGHEVEQLAADQHPIKIDAASKKTDSVTDWIAACEFDQILILDMDFPLSASTIQEMLTELKEHSDGFVIARPSNVSSGVSQFVRARLIQPLSKAGDPSSGCCLFRKSQVDGVPLYPVGEALGLELYVRGRFSSLHEVLEFGEGPGSKGCLSLNFFRHLRRLYVFKFGGLAEFVNFGAVGASGFVVDICFYFLLQWLGLTHITARALSFWPAVSWNWALNRLTTFGERRKRPKARQWLEFVSSSLIGFLISWGSYTYLTTNHAFFGEHKVVALITGILGASLFNFAASSLFVYSNKRAASGET